MARPNRFVGAMHRREATTCYSGLLGASREAVTRRPATDANRGDANPNSHVHSSYFPLSTGIWPTSTASVSATEIGLPFFAIWLLRLSAPLTDRRVTARSTSWTIDIEPARAVWDVSIQRQPASASIRQHRSLPFHLCPRAPDAQSLDRNAYWAAL